eukprot:5654075-Amphidinium_carterae.1
MRSLFQDRKNPGIVLPPPTCHTVGTWCEFVLADQQRWLLLVKSHACPDPPLCEVRVPADGPEVIFEAKFVCEERGFPAKSAAGLAMHARRTHGIEAPLSLLVRTAKCPACKLTATTRDRALDHLKNSRRVYVEANVVHMTREELIAARAKEFG